MALIKDWLAKYIDRHRKQFNPHDWPQPGSEEMAEFSKLWFHAFLDERVQEHEANVASTRLGSEPPRFRNDHLPRVLNEVLSLRKERAADMSAGTIPTERSDAERASRLCPHCSGTGLATIYHPRYDGTPTVEVEGKGGEVVQMISRCAAHCSCVMGRWMRGHTDEPELKRVPCLVKTQAQTRWTLNNPTTAADGRDVFEPKNWRELARRLAERNAERQTTGGPCRLADEVGADAYPTSVRDDPVLAADLASRVRRGEVPF